MFTIGQEVVCITNDLKDIRKGERVTVSRVNDYCTWFEDKRWDYPKSHFEAINKEEPEMSKVTFTDVTEKFVGIVDAPDCKLIEVRAASKEFCLGGILCVVYTDGDGDMMADSFPESDLIPAPAPKSPWDEVLPYLGHWWRLATKPDRVMRIASLRTGTNPRATFLGYNDKEETAIEFLSDYEHSADPINGPWKRIGEKSQPPVPSSSR